MSYLYIGLGANLTPAGYSNPRDGCEAALVALKEEGVLLEQVSNWYETAPVTKHDGHYHGVAGECNNCNRSLSSSTKMFELKPKRHTTKNEHKTRKNGPKACRHLCSHVICADRQPMVDDKQSACNM